MERLKKNGISDFEILIFDDHSTDTTGKVADEPAEKYPQIKVIHNTKNMNLGYNITTKAFRIKNIVSVFKTFLTLFCEVQILRRRIKID